MSFPYQLDDASDFFNVADFAISKISSPITDSSTQIQVESGDRLPTGRFIITLGGSELVIIAHKEQNILQVEQRGCFGSTASDWPSGTLAIATMAAKHYDLIRDGILALQSHMWTYQSTVESIAIDPDSITPQSGDAFLVGVGAVGAWQGKDRQLARWADVEWKFISPTIGTTIYIKHVGRLDFNGTNWIHNLDYQAVGTVIPALNSQRKLSASTIPQTLNDTSISGSFAKQTKVVTLSNTSTITPNEIRYNNVLVVSSTDDTVIILPTGDSMSMVTQLDNHMMFEWSVINSNIIDGVALTSNQKHSIVGNHVILPTMSARFGTKFNTVSNCWTTYRLS